MITLLSLSILELKADGTLSNEPYDYTFNGFYPPFYDDEKNFVRDDGMENYIDTYMDIDVKDYINLSNVNPFRKYIDLRADNTKGKVYYLGDISCDINGIEYVSWTNWGERN